MIPSLHGFLRLSVGYFLRLMLITVIKCCTQRVLYPLSFLEMFLSHPTITSLKSNGVKTKPGVSTVRPLYKEHRCGSQFPGGRVSRFNCHIPR